MTSPNSTFTELVSTTIQNRKRTIADNVSKLNAAFSLMMATGKKRVVKGGTSIVCELDYAENSTYTRYSGYGLLNVQASDVITSAEYAWKQAAVTISASGRELRINSGDEAMINLSASKIKNGIRTMANNLSTDFYSDGTATNQITGLQAIIADAGTGTVGGINSSTFTFWQNVVQDANSPLSGGGAVTPSATTIEALMLGLYLEIMSNGGGEPKLIVADQNYYTFFDNSQTSLKRYKGESNEALAGFTTMKFRNADVVFDGGSGIPSNHMYFVDTDYLEIVVHKDADMTQLEERSAVNQDAAVIPIISMLNLTCSNRRQQGVLFDSTP